MDNHSALGPDLCTESQLNYVASALLEVDVLAKVRKRHKIAATINESKKGDTTADSNKGGTSADYNNGIVSGSAVSPQEHVYLTFR